MMTTAKAGAKVNIRLRYDGKTHKHTVLEPCDQKENGLWYCTTHLESFMNPMDKDAHISCESKHGPAAKHVLVWLCFAHGPEQP